jgi:hypothetical protein
MALRQDSIPLLGGAPQVEALSECIAVPTPTHLFGRPRLIYAIRRAKTTIICFEVLSLFC